MKIFPVAIPAAGYKPQLFKVCELAADVLEIFSGKAGKFPGIEIFLKKWEERA